MDKKLKKEIVKLADVNDNMVEIPMENIYTFLTSEEPIEGLVEYDEGVFPIDLIRHNLFTDIADTLHSSYYEPNIETYALNLAALFLEAIKDGTISNEEYDYHKIITTILKVKANEYDKDTVEYMALKTALMVFKNEDSKW